MQFTGNLADMEGKKKNQSKLPENFRKVTPTGFENLIWQKRKHHFYDSGKQKQMYPIFFFVRELSCITITAAFI